MSDPGSIPEEDELAPSEVVTAGDVENEDDQRQGVANPSVGLEDETDEAGRVS